MAYLTKLYTPSGFRDSKNFALNQVTGELIKWKWPSLNPEDFCIDEKGNLWHDCDDKKTLSRIVRNGLPANNFFKKSKSIPNLKNEKNQTINIGERQKNKHFISTSGNSRLRKRKYKKKKYKNSKARSQKREKKRRQEKVFKKAVESCVIEKSLPPIIERCKFCDNTNQNSNIFNNPFEKHSCDFCESKFNGIQLHGKVCDDCLNIVYRLNFCDLCKKNLGVWDINWRQNLGIPYEDHPVRCSCTDCISYPCGRCYNEDHCSRNCPWRSNVWPPTIYIPEPSGPEDLEDYFAYYHVMEPNRIEDAARDDYLFGW